VFFEKFLSPDELRSEAEAKRKLNAELDARSVLEGRDRQVQRDRQPRPVEAQLDQQPRRVESGRSSEFSQFPASNNDPLEALRRLTPSGQRPTANRPSSQEENVRAEPRPPGRPPGARVTVLPVQQDSLPKVPGVDAVLQQEADLRKLQQQFRPVPDENYSSQRLAPWELAEQQRLKQEQARLRPEEQRLQQEQPRLRPEEQQSRIEELAPWEVAEQRRLQQEQQRLQPEQSFRQEQQSTEEQLAPWEVAEQQRLQQEQQRSLEPWEIAEQRREQQEAAGRFEDEDFDFVLGRDTIVNQDTFPKVPGLETVLQQEAALRDLQQQTAREQGLIIEDQGFRQQGVQQQQQQTSTQFTLPTQFTSIPQEPSSFAVPGLDQHSRFVAELQAAQENLRALT